MLLYEDERTKSIVSHLIIISNFVRYVTITSSVIFLGAFLSILGSAIQRELWWLGGITGILFGYVLGSYLASVFLVVIEWMAQLLVAQGEILAALKKKD